MNTTTAPTHRYTGPTFDHTKGRIHGAALEHNAEGWLISDGVIEQDGQRLVGFKPQAMANTSLFIYIEQRHLEPIEPARPYRTLPIPEAKGGHRDDHGVHGEDPCGICGRAVTSPAGYVHEVDGGGRMLHVDDEAIYNDPAADLGFFPVGSECAKRIPAGYLHKR